MLTHTKAGWTVAAAGLIAFSMGVAGLVDQDGQLRLLGVDPSTIPADDPLRITLTSGSVAAANNGAAFVLGVAKSWPWFPHFTVATRSAQAVGFLARIATGRAPRSYLGAAIWEAAGAALTVGALWLDRRASR
ncbi:hypothetical protein [Kutzneria buriramensis]|uniref:DUF4345 domain-containing protein n=1 Tax=Kutzneria buriramensis TaxID=1045776 RepID=A0A3E0GXB5_9PSEU|nr:hypothetical protein [Kutzneria buriramensis]REH29588.1 hypothetical protein BCF44_12415 [Kutzneria buriramensis]